MAILGLMTTEQLKANYSLSARRNVFYQYPNGASPLMGLLSLMDDESTDKAEFGWNEERFETHQTTTAQANSAGPFTDTSGSSGAAGTDLTAAGWTQAKGTTIRVQLADVSTVQVRDVLQIRNAKTTTNDVTIQAIVVAVWAAENTVDIRLTAAATAVLNSTANNGLDVIMVGSAAAEGDRSKQGFTIWPIEVSNYTQIHRHAFDFTRTALKAGLKFDSSGVYKTKAKKNSLKHMKALEYAAMFSEKSLEVGTTTADGLASVTRTTGGLLYYLKQWELGNTGNGGEFNYRPNGANVTNSDWKTTDDKRIINAGGSVSQDEFEMLVERAFRYTNDESFEKLVLCGSGVISAFNKFVDRAALKTTKLSTEEAYGMNVVSWESPHGVLHFKSHPLLTQTPTYRNSGFILDCGNLKYTPLNDSDTNLLKNRQPRDFDGRKDEWLTEAGLEVRFPESHMWIDNLTGITA